MSNDWKPRTKLVHGGIRRSQYNEVSEAIFLTQGFVYDTAEQAQERFRETGPDEFIYARYGNPTVAMFEDRMAMLEGTEDAFATASGMAAVNAALMSVCKAGDHVVAAKALFGSCLYILEKVLGRYGVEITLVDGTDLDAWRAAVRDDTVAVFFESTSNPTLEVIDIKGVAEIAHAHGALVIVDNVFATPVYSKAVELGADVIVYSATKHIDGQGRALGGIILGTQDYIRETLMPYLKHSGGALSPFNAWLMLKGMETIELRVNAQSANAIALTEALQGHAKLARVIYPGHPSHAQYDLVQRQTNGQGGTVVSIDLAGGKEAAFRFLNAITVGVLSNNLGDAKSIYTHPETTTHSSLTDDQRAALGITSGLVRISLGIEDGEDIVADVLAALEQA
ncbi:O-succinylhomoserine sulfhydrylase [Pseudooceanicola spongiae]|uniref:O-succinylhomoserine sulfhydrylase n=1 Tax=Pseudooceanicola spongiae TaxID=2613965 RepID=A0A7L9WNS2_9RHOB|nr:O-succinylhomoserine sulfhydrylase [Pseudooceanicola spongiae]QOL81056.1 O-succinylhomoserine sulfhydrylase [Pseudooceanicola spongiae]